LFNRLSRELPGIARWALGGLRDLEEQGRFSPTQKGKDLQKRMIQESAFVRLFVEECCELGAEFRVANDSLYAEYSVWAEQNRMPVYNSVKFARELHDAFPGSVATVSFRKNGKVVRGQSGVKLR
jgi:putative DNA primase/helicase